MMKDPPHPGGTIKEDCIEAEGLTVTEAARLLGVTRPTLSRVINGRGGVSAEMAIRFEKIGWSNAEFWMRLQTNYDLAQARLNEDRINVEPFPASGSSLLAPRIRSTRYWKVAGGEPGATRLRTG